MGAWDNEKGMEGIRTVREEGLFRLHQRRIRQRAHILQRSGLYVRQRSVQKGWLQRWYLVDALEFMTERKPQPLAGPFDSLENLLKAPLLDGKSIDQRYYEIGTSDTFRIVEE